MYLSQLLILIEDPESGTASESEVASALLLPCEASKSEKLSMAFDLFAHSKVADKAGDSSELVVSQYGLRCVFRCLLASLLAVHEDSNARPTADVRRELDEASAAIAADAMAFANATNDDTDSEDEISMGQVSEWYNDGGFTVVPWFELLNRAKWEPLDADQS